MVKVGKKEVAKASSKASPKASPKPSLKPSAEDDKAKKQYPHPLFLSIIS